MPSQIRPSRLETVTPANPTTRNLRRPNRSADVPASNVIRARTRNAAARIRGAGLFGARNPVWISDVESVRYPGSKTVTAAAAVQARRIRHA